MASSLSQHEAAAKALESDLLSSHTRTDYELIEQEGKKLAKLMSSIGSLDKDIRRKILGPVLTEFSAEYMNACKAIHGGQDPKTYRFDQRWEVMAKGKAPEQRLNLPAMDLTQVTKKKAPKPPGPSKPPTIWTSSEKPADVGEKSVAGASSKQVAFSFNTDESGAQPSVLQELASAMAAITKPNPTPPTKAAMAKPPAKAPGAPKLPAKVPAKAKKAAASTTKPVKAPEYMDVDKPETVAGGPNKARETDKQRREKGEAPYNPDDNLAATDYADERVGGKRKVQSGKNGSQKKKPKSVTIIVDSEEEIPLKGKGKAAESKASTSTAAVGTTAAKASTSTAATASTSTAAKASMSTAAVRKTAAKASTSMAKVAKPRSSFRKHLAPHVMAPLDAMIGAGRIMDAENLWYVEWTKNLPHRLRPIKGLRDNTPCAVVLMGERLTPPPSLKATEKTCDWCADFAPMWCFMVDQGTACLMCNIFRKKACMLNGVKVNPYHSGSWRKDEIVAEAEKTGGKQGPATRKPAAKPTISKKAAEAHNSGAKAPATKKPAAKSSASTSKLSPVSRPTTSTDTHTQALDELNATQGKHAASICSIQSQMDTMALGMVACRSLLKTAQDDLRRQATKTQELEGMVAEGPHFNHPRLDRDAPQQLGELIHTGARFSELFVTLATDVTNTTRALSQWLTGNPDVEMRGPEGEGNDGGLGEDTDANEEDLPIEQDEEGNTYQAYSDMGEA